MTTTYPSPTDNAQIMAPRRARLPEALAAVTDVDAAEWRHVLRTCGLTWRDDHVLVVGSDHRPGLRAPFTTSVPEAAWAAMVARGLVPTSWERDPMRTFSEQVLSGRYYEYLEPQSIAQCVAIAADVDTLERVERFVGVFARSAKIDLQGSVLVLYAQLDRINTNDYINPIARAVMQNAGATDPQRSAVLEIARLGYFTTPVTTTRGERACAVLVPSLEVAPGSYAERL
jgi:hypothetical protein